MASEGLTRRLAAILVADVVGYTRKMRASEADTLADLRALRSEVLEPATQRHRGRTVKTMGDGVLVEFQSAVDAAECALDVQQVLARRNGTLPEHQRLELRIGINLGDIVVDDDDIYGDGVNVAARLEAICEGGEICVSSDVHSQVRDKVAASFDDLGAQTLKNIDAPIRVFRMAPLGTAASDVETTVSPLERPAVAVLPFQNMSGDPEQEYFVDGLTEDIITALSVWRSFPVVARNSVFVYKGTLLDVRKVGEELGARYVVEGSARKSNGRIRVTAQLIDSKIGHHLWAERYDRDLADIFEVQDELTRKISAVVLPEVERAESTRLRAAAPDNLDAWDYVLRGMAGINDFTEDGTRLAREMFVKAIDLDPRYSRADSGLARCNYTEMALGISQDIEERVADSRAAAGRAVDLDETDSVAHEMLGIALMFEGQSPEAVAELELAIELNPSNARAYSNLGYALALAGRAEEGVMQSQMGLALNPHDPRNAHYLAMQSLAHLSARQYEAAVRSAEKSIQRRTDNPQAYFYLAISLGHLGRPADAAAALETCHQQSAGFAERTLRWISFAKAADREHLLDGLRQAGWDG